MSRWFPGACVAALFLVPLSGCVSGSVTSGDGGSGGATAQNCGVTSFGYGFLAMPHAEFTDDAADGVPGDAQHLIDFGGAIHPECVSPFSQYDCQGGYVDIRVPPELFQVGTFQFSDPGVAVTSSKYNLDPCNCKVTKAAYTTGQVQITAITETSVSVIVSDEQTNWSSPDTEVEISRCP